MLFSFEKMTGHLKTEKIVLFLDEPKLKLFRGDSRQCERRPKNKRCDSRYVYPTTKHVGGHIVLFRLISEKVACPFVEIRRKMIDAMYKVIL